MHSRGERESAIVVSGSAVAQTSEFHRDCIANAFQSRRIAASVVDCGAVLQSSGPMNVAASSEAVDSESCEDVVVQVCSVKSRMGLMEVAS